MFTWPSPQIPQIPGSLDTVRVHDAMSNELVEVSFGPTASIYVCGVTPYDATHIGHAATYIAFDILNRALRDAGKTVAYASNVTDVDDPLLERARETQRDWEELAREQIALFAEDMTALGVVPPDTYVGAVESIPDVVPAIEQLVEQGAAYRVAVPELERPVHADAYDIYADVNADSRFGSVSRLDDEEKLALFSQRGGDPQRPGKRSPLDPLLWKAARHDEPAWPGNALGEGRPGWHIECALIAQQGLGSRFSVVGGGSDLMFPHHEMSASHLRMLSGDSQAGARVCVHAGLVSYDGEKMSKSRGNLVFVSRLRHQGVEPMIIRLAILSQHYRSEWEWTEDLLLAATDRYKLWLEAFSGNGGPDATETLEHMRAALREDLDTPRALEAVDNWARLCLAGEVDFVEGAPGVMSRAVNALLGVRL
ncbi:cysteine--1-D-myo-inosityl 2-amino-2-deoxy-alpha-D-glucopyranoside ligase [Timonella sp. A28]|uniref:cysteine--1-D-myo-inosityl 2-amino-2-deoxy-alpha-D-glucopyranoside ligase n=1 Tax=Timonella sp. A28 TaxID=3442640 RepID=UPI003EBB2A78